MNTIVKSKQLSDKISVNVMVDYDAYSPREMGDMFGTIYANSKRYNPDNRSLEEFDNGNGEVDIKRLDKDYLYLTIYFYEHGGITLSTSRVGCFADRWDSGLFGIIAVSKEDARKNWGIKRLTKKYKDHAYKILQDEVDELNAWYMGDCYRYEVVDTENDEVLESCYGYYGYELIDYALEDGVYIGKGYVEEEMRLLPSFRRF